MGVGRRQGTDQLRTLRPQHSVQSMVSHCPLANADFQY